MVVLAELLHLHEQTMMGEERTDDVGGIMRAVPLYTAIV
jgi:hypothetical protein